MSPDGAAPFQGKMNEDIAVMFDQPGAEAQAVPQKGKAKKRFELLFETAGQ